MPIERLRDWIASHGRRVAVAVGCVVMVVAAGTAVVGLEPWAASETRPATNETTVSNATFPTPTATAALPDATDDSEATKTSRENADASSVSVPPDGSWPHPPTGVGVGAWRGAIGGTQPPATPHAPAPLATPHAPTPPATPQAAAVAPVATIPTTTGSLTLP